MRCSRCLIKIPQGEGVLVPGEVYEGYGSGSSYLCLECSKKNQTWNTIVLWIMAILLIIVIIVAVAKQ